MEGARVLPSKAFSFTASLCLLSCYLKLGQAMEGVLVSARYRHGRVTGVTPIRALQVTANSCLHMCFRDSSCSAMQYVASAGECQLLDTSLCDSGITGHDLTFDPDWRYYDVKNSKAGKSGDIFLNTDMCVNEGKCSAKCGRSLGEDCSSDAQCNTLVRRSRCDDSVCVIPIFASTAKILTGSLVNQISVCNNENADPAPILTIDEKNEVQTVFQSLVMHAGNVGEGGLKYVWLSASRASPTAELLWMDGTPVIGEAFKASDTGVFADDGPVSILEETLNVYVSQEAYAETNLYAVLCRRRK